MAPTLGHVAALPIHLPMVWTWGVGISAPTRIVGIGTGAAMAHVGVCSTGRHAGWTGRCQHTQQDGASVEGLGRLLSGPHASRAAPHCMQLTLHLAGQLVDIVVAGRPWCCSLQAQGCNRYIVGLHASLRVLLLQLQGRRPHNSVQGWLQDEQAVVWLKTAQKVCQRALCQLGVPSAPAESHSVVQNRLQDRQAVI